MLYLPLLTFAATSALAATTTTRAPRAAASSAAAPAAASASPAASGGNNAASVPTSERTNEAQEAAIMNPIAECAGYFYQPVADVVGTYPPIWATANLSFPGVLDSDKALFTAMQPNIPKIAPRGTRAGDFTGVTYDMANDPDCWWTDTRCTTPKLAGLDPDVTRCEEPNTWGLTLDDGPNCSHNAYFDYLLSIKQKATLFYIGSNVLDWPLEAQRGLTDGHEICAHTYSHPYMTSMTDEQAFAEMYYSKKAIKEVLGITVRCVRMPYGDVDDRIRWIAKNLDMTVIQWEHDTFDYDWNVDGIPSVKKNYDAILALQANGTYDTAGTIVLSHEIDAETMALSQEYLPIIRKAFTGGVMPVGTCMNITVPYAEGPSYVYPNYAQWQAGTQSVSLLAPTAASVNVELAMTPSVTATASIGAAAGIVTSVTTSATRLSQVPTTTSSGAKSADTSKPKTGAASSLIGGGIIAFCLTALSGAFLVV